MEVVGGWWGVRIGCQRFMEAVSVEKYEKVLEVDGGTVAQQ